MSLSDPIADMLTRIRNAQLVEHVTVSMSYSRMKGAIAQVLKEEGYIEDFAVVDGTPGLRQLDIVLKYYEDAPVIAKISRVSRPGLRIYKKVKDMPRVMNGLGIAILSTSHGVLTDKHARQKNVGGEVLCTIA